MAERKNKVNNYDSLVERVARAADLAKEEIERKVEAKRAKLSGLISKEGAAQIVAAELGISFEQERMKLKELVHGMKRANVIGRVTKVFPIREYSKNGKEGKIGSFLFGDESANIRVVLWDLAHIALIEKAELKEGDVFEISNGNVRNGELHLSGFSDIKKSNEKLEDVMEERTFSEGKLKDARAGEGVKVRAVVVQMFEPRQFVSKKDGKEGVLLNIVLDDGTETIRAVMFGERIKDLGLSDEEIKSPEKFAIRKLEILGEEKLFIGNYRMNTFFNRVEMAIDGIEDVKVDELVKELESKAP